MQGSGLLANSYDKFTNLAGNLGMSEMNAGRGDFWNAYGAQQQASQFDRQMDLAESQAKSAGGGTQKKRGGIGGMLGSIGGTLLGSIAGPIGSAIGGKIGGSLFG